MEKIFKYPVATMPEFVIAMPRNAKILTVQNQYGNPMLWALVNPEAETEQRKFRVFGTGHTIKDLNGAEYIATYQLNDGTFIGHLFEEKQ